MKNIGYIFAFVFLFHFMGVIEIQSGIYFIITCLLAVISFKKGLPVNKMILLVFFFLLLNAITCLYFRGQSIIDSLRASTQFYELSLVWFLYRWKCNIAKWEKMLYWIILVFGVCFIIQYFAMPKIIFGGQIRTDMNEHRMAIYGQGLGSLGILFGLNKYIITKRLRYIAILLLGVFAVLGVGYRSILISVILCSIYMLLKLGFRIKYIIYATILIGVIWLIFPSIPLIGDSIEHMISRNESMQSESVQDNARYITFFYYYDHFFKSPIEAFLGAGAPHRDSRLGQLVENLQQSGIWSSDLGLIGLTWVIGIPAVFCMLCYCVKVFTTRLPKQYLYVNIWFIEIILSSFTSHEFYIHCNFTVQAIMLCIYCKLYDVYKRDNYQPAVKTVNYQQ